VGPDHGRKMAMNQGGLGGLGDLSNLDAATLQRLLPGVRFPAEKDEVANTAERNDQERRHPTLQRPRRGFAGGATRPLEQAACVFGSIAVRMVLEVA
jgi:hypothetical protein